MTLPQGTSKTSIVRGSSLSCNLDLFRADRVSGGLNQEQLNGGPDYESAVVQRNESGMDRDLDEGSVQDATANLGTEMAHIAVRTSEAFCHLFKNLILGTAVNRESPLREGPPQDHFILQCGNDVEFSLTLETTATVTGTVCDHWPFLPSSNLNDSYSDTKDNSYSSQQDGRYTYTHSYSNNSGRRGNSSGLNTRKWTANDSKETPSEGLFKHFCSKILD